MIYQEDHIKLQMNIDQSLEIRLLCAQFRIEDYKKTSTGTIQVG